MVRSSQIPLVCLVGPANTRTAYALVNHHWAEHLRRDARLRFVHSDTLADAAPGACILFHDYAIDFATVEVPGAMAMAVRPWDFGPYPEAWVRRINRDWAQLWVPSTWLREQACRGGVGEDKVRVVPLGVDAAVYRPSGPRQRLPTEKTFRFLFVGAPIYRKGVDVLLAAYQSAFDARDDTALVIKANPREIFYAGQTLHETIREQAARPQAPEIVLLDEHLADDELAALYRACTVGVFPYRAEGFCLPILEAMACGTPCIVPRFGACLDYCADDNAFLMPVRRMRLPVSGQFTVNTLGFEAAVSEVDFCEPAVDVLAEQMRAVYEGERALVAQKGCQAADLAQARFTWSHSVDILVSLVLELAAR